jgi:DedD protein
MALGLIALPGFALGLVAGVAWEEPSLLGSHLLGGTTDVVSWSSATERDRPSHEPAAPLPDVAAARRADAVPAPVRPQSATRLRPDVLSPGAAAARFAVQVGAFGEGAVAEQLATRLRGKGFDVYVSPAAAAGQPRWRVRVGPVSSREEADRVAARLKVEEQLPTWVLEDDGSV